ncbi:MAG: hypothetical protein Q8Q10_03620 [bacterium]|nr:hypothetical protein [bacterium]
MINICHQAGGQYAFAHYPESDEEEAYWKGLVREVNYQHIDCAVVGLWIVTEFKMNNRNVVVTSVGEKARLNGEDVTRFQTLIEAEILEKLKGERDVAI